VRRTPSLATLARWLVALGVVTIFSGGGYTFIVKGSVHNQGEITERLADRLEFLETALDNAIAAKDSVAIAEEVERTKNSLARAHRRLDRRQAELEGMWHLNGRGPMLIVAGLVLVGIGVRLRRFEAYGE